MIELNCSAEWEPSPPNLTQTAQHKSYILAIWYRALQRISFSMGSNDEPSLDAIKDSHPCTTWQLSKYFLPLTILRAAMPWHMLQLLRFATNKLTFICRDIVDLHPNLIDQLQYGLHGLIQYFHKQQRKLLPERGVKRCKVNYQLTQKFDKEFKVENRKTV